MPKQQLWTCGLFKCYVGFAAKMGAKRVLIQSNHGPIVAAEDVPTAWWYLYYLERAAKLTLAAMSTGKPLRVISDKVCLGILQAIASPAGGLWKAGQRRA